MSGRLYLWAHELCHAWIALRLGCCKVMVEVQETTGQCWWTKESITDLENAQIRSAPFVFFLFRQQKIDKYLMQENGEARKEYNTHVGRETHIREYFRDVQQPVRHMLPDAERIMGLARHYEYRRHSLDVPNLPSLELYMDVASECKPHEMIHVADMATLERT